MFNRFLSSLKQRYFQKIGVDSSKVVFANDSKPLLFTNDEIPVVGGLYYCSCLFLSPRVKSENFTSIALHVEAVTNDISDYKIGDLASRVKEINGCDGVDAALYGRHFMSYSTLSAYGSRNLTTIQDELYRNGIFPEDITRGSAHKNSILVNGSLLHFPDVLYKNMRLEKNKRPGNSFSPKGCSSAQYEAFSDGPPILTHRLYDNDERVTIDNIYDCTVGVLRSNSSNKFVVFHVNHIFDHEKSELVIKNSIASMLDTCNNTNSKIDAQIYSRHFDSTFVPDVNLNRVKSSLDRNLVSYSCLSGFAPSVKIDFKNICEVGIFDKPKFFAR